MYLRRDTCLQLVPCRPARNGCGVTNAGRVRDGAGTCPQGGPRRRRKIRGRRTVQKKKGPLEDLPQGARESSGDLLSRIRGPGTIGDLRLDFRVRDGNGYDPHSITAETISCMEI